VSKEGRVQGGRRAKSGREGIMKTRRKIKEGLEMVK